MATFDPDDCVRLHLEDLTVEELLGEDFVPLDVNYWIAAYYWTAEEAASISLELDPRSATLLRHISPSFSESYLRRLELVRRAQESLGEKIRPPEFVKFAKEHGINCPEEIAAEIGGRKKAAEASAEADELLHPKRRASVYMFILGLVTSTYGHEPTAEGKWPTGEIVVDLKRSGFGLDDGVVLQILRAAFEAAGHRRQKVVGSDEPISVRAKPKSGQKP